LAAERIKLDSICQQTGVRLFSIWGYGMTFR
jgi:hypothetical protein